MTQGSSDRRRRRQAKAAPPPTTDGASTEEACQQCSLVPESPCDVDKLVLEVTDRDGATKKLETTTSHNRLRPVNLEDVEVRNMLRQHYDVLIDVIADVDARNWSGPKPAKIGGKAFFHGRSCTPQKHAELELRPLGNAPELDGETEIIETQPGASMLKIDPVELFAKPNWIIDDLAVEDDAPLDAVSSVFGIITLLWDVKDPRIVAFTARSCGVRAKEDTKAANLNLKGAARIYRKSTLAVGIKIPALGQFERVRAGDVLSGERTATDTGRLGTAVRATASATRPDESGQGVTAVGRERRGDTITDRTLQSDLSGDQPRTTGYRETVTQGGTTTTTGDLGTITKHDVEAKLASAGGFEVVITHNGTEIKALDAIQKLRDLVNDIGQVLTDIQNLFNSAPQLGWKFTFEVSVFAGTILLEWFPEYVPGVQAGGRYLAVQWKLQGKIEIEVFNIKVAASFGIDARARGTGLVLKAEGTLSGKASVATDVALDLFKPRREVEIAGEAGADLKVVGNASVFGKTLADAELKGEGGVELADGKLVIEWDKRKADLQGVLKLKPVVITGFVRGWLWDTELDPITIMDEKVLYTFT